MVVLDDVALPPIDAVRREDETNGQPRCTLCLVWRPADEMIRINPLVTWCTDCALSHPELVPPPGDLVWPAVGFLAGAAGGSLLAIGQAATQVV